MSRKCFHTNSYLSASLDRQGLLVAAPVDLRTKKAESVTRQLLHGFWYKLKKESQDRCDVPDCCNEELQATRSYLATVPFILGRGRTPNPWRKTLPYFGTRNRKNLVVHEGTISPETVPLPMGLPTWKKQVDFHNLGNPSRPLESIPASRQRVVPAEGQVGTILGDGISKARVITVQAPQ